MSEMVERVARAICASNGTFAAEASADCLVRQIDGSEIPRWRLFEDNARAAIKAMRDPTIAMENAFTMALARSFGWPCTEAWNAAIDEALK